MVAMTSQGTAARPPRGAYWQHVVLTRVALARDDVRRCRAERPDDEGLRQAEDLLRAAEEAAARPSPRLRTWLTGSAINHAFTSLHAAQVLLARYAPEHGLEGRLLSALARLQSTVPASETRRRMIETHLAAASANGAAGPRAADGARLSTARRWLLEKALDWSYAASDAQYARLRSFRNIVVIVALAVLGLAVGLGAMGAAWPESLQLCFAGEAGGQVCPTGARATPRDGLVIEVLGTTGGALAAVLAIRKMQGTSTPYSVPLALALLKLPLGALSALVGLLLIHGRFVPGLTDLDTSGQILAYAVVLGVAQQAVTALVDRRGQELLNRIPSKGGDGTGRAAPAGSPSGPATPGLVPVPGRAGGPSEAAASGGGASGGAAPVPATAGVAGAS